MSGDGPKAKGKATAGTAASVFGLSNRNPRKKEAMKAAAALEASRKSGRSAIEIMVEATGEPSARCAGYLNTSPGFSALSPGEKAAALFLDRRGREEPREKEAATAPACSGPLVQVRRHFDDWRIASVPAFRHLRHPLG